MVNKQPLVTIMLLTFVLCVIVFILFIPLSTLLFPKFWGNSLVQIISAVVLMLWLPVASVWQRTKNKTFKYVGAGLLLILLLSSIIGVGRGIVSVSEKIHITGGKDWDVIIYVCLPILTILMLLVIGNMLSKLIGLFNRVQQRKEG